MKNASMQVNFKTAEGTCPDEERLYAEGAEEVEEEIEKLKG